MRCCSAYVSTKIFILFGVSRGSNVVRAEPEKAQHFPPQTECANRRASRKSDDVFTPKIVPLVWSVASITRRKRSQLKGFSTNKNVCDVFSFTDDCTAIRSTTTTVTPEYSTTQTLAYSATTRDIVVIDRVLRPSKDKNHLIWTTKVNKMSYARSAEKSEIESDIPPAMSEINGQPIMFAVVAAHPYDKWTIFQMCNSDDVWIMVPTEEARGNPSYLKPYEEEITEELRELKVELRDMASLHINLPFEPPNQIEPFGFAPW